MKKYLKCETQKDYFVTLWLAAYFNYRPQGLGYNPSENKFLVALEIYGGSTDSPENYDLFLDTLNSIYPSVTCS